ncbi:MULTISPECIES: YHS domain-containing protein [Pseudothermotoga]|jgi:YHS domain-containing protein|uniref:YHS domain protein n=1 Tax=Pseudothermotoga lettingae (strain ATCC BAA-301 / DSM 14385 / NBRC 107922 / TMO) TaxID=416591 RepID=A8F8J7_PSELT|nr:MULTISPECIES: YHS domain-containing protein [Pseudothermotoga]ABV34481.1 YHS domain protein [Pseudothermotoga lettingae TMO]GLI48572.1 YHS domain-containing protein [Pseudothermotoga lettingae TMO]HBJ81306.1 YHS domain-containing protein [Pseudothermotoga sp.]
MKVKDPVCGMKIKIHEAAEKFEYMGKEYYFCSKECSEKFKSDPNKFIQPSKKHGCCH